MNFLYNAIKTPDGTILVSKNRHDYVTYTDKNGHEYMVDGGGWYLRRNIVKDAPYEELSVEDDGKHETRREWLRWGKNYDKERKRLKETQYVPIKDLDLDHIEKILELPYIDNFYKEVFKEELKFRKK